MQSAFTAAYVSVERHAAAILRPDAAARSMVALQTAVHFHHHDAQAA